MLQAHINAVEGTLLATSQIPANSGHSLHKGTPRETFIRQFLNGHLSERAAVGTGEIIDASSGPGQQRNQHDIVVYRRDFPRLDFGGGITAYLAESVIATIEVKSTLDKEELRKATRAAANTKALQRQPMSGFFGGYQPPSILNYVVAYDGPASMATVHGWLPDLGVGYPSLSVNDEERIKTASTALDGVFVLGRGFLQFGNAPTGFLNAGTLTQHPNIKWAVGNVPQGTLLLLFLQLTAAVSGSASVVFNPLPYVARFAIPNEQLSYGD